MTQYRFTRALLEVAHEDGLHTCLETSGFAPWNRYRSILPWVDHILVDYKATGSGRHAELTGVPNEKILENIEAIYCTGVAMTIRCPLIPGLNDAEDHLAAIAGLGKRYPGIDRIELMAYHSTGQDTSARIGESPRWVGPDSASEDDRHRWLDVIRSHGCDRAVIG